MPPLRINAPLVSSDSEMGNFEVMTSIIRRLTLADSGLAADWLDLLSRRPSHGRQGPPPQPPKATRRDRKQT